MYQIMNRGKHINNRKFDQLYGRYLFGVFFWKLRGLPTVTMVGEDFNVRQDT